MVFSLKKHKGKKAGMPVSTFHTTWTSPLLSRHGAWRKDQFAKSFRNVEIGRWGSRGLPGGIKSRFGSSFDAVEIHSPGGRWIEALNEAFHRQRKLRDPGFSGFVQNNAAPQSTLQVVLLARRDVEIDPKAIRADFEFSIAAKLRRVGLKENFRDVAVPELVAAAVGRASGNTVMARYFAWNRRKSDSGVQSSLTAVSRSGSAFLPCQSALKCKGAETSHEDGVGNPSPSGSSGIRTATAVRLLDIMSCRDIRRKLPRSFPPHSNCGAPHRITIAW